MAPGTRSRALGLRKIAPVGDANNTDIDIIAIHGLATESPGTWEFKRGEGGAVNWLADTNMLPEAVPEARIFTYDWDANFFENAPVQTLLGHADNLLALVAESRGSEIRPIIFVASCFGGLVLAEALTRASEEGSAYRQILLFTVGVVFLATPFHGTDADEQARWQVVVGGIMGKQTSDQLVRDLERSDHVHNGVQKFAEMANRVRLPIHCFYETKKTMMLRKHLSRGLAKIFSTSSTHKILVKQSSACLHGFPRQGLDATHSGMNKFESPGSSNFKLVKEAIKQLANDAPTVLKRWENSAREHHFVVPFGRNKDFVGRKEILSHLLKRTPPSRDEDDCQRTAIEGLGGVGKTQIALEAAFQVCGDCSVFWVPAVDATSFENAYRDIGRRLGIAGMSEDKADVKALVKAALSDESAGRWLLIVDNADDIELLFSATGTGLSDYLPFSRMGSILFTTGNHEVAVRLDVPKRGIINTVEMSQEEATELLQRNLKESQTRDTKNTAELLDLLANLPLAIKQASAYMAKEQISTSEYLELFRSSDKDMIDLLSKNFEDRYRYQGIQNPVATTWLISFRQISHVNPLAADYLRFVCFLAEKDIPKSLLPPAGGIPTAEATGALKAYAFITEREGGDSFDVHRLVRLAMQDWLDKRGELEECITRAIQRLAEAFPSPKHENRDVWVKYLPHAQTALEFRKGSSDEKTKSGLLHNVATCYHILGKYQAAEQIYRQTLELRQKVLGKEHPDTLNSINNVANVLYHQGRYKEAEAIYRQTLELMEKVLGKEHPSTLTSIINLANVLNQQGRYKEAEAIYRQTLELVEKVLGKEHPDTLGSINNLATVLQDQGKYEEAEQMHRQTLELREKVLGKEHPDTLDSINNLAGALYGQGRYEEAEAIHRQTLELMEKVLGKEHPDTLGSINNLATVLQDQGKYEEAEQMHRQTLELREKVLGKEHPGTLRSMNNLANVLRNQGRYKEAEAIYRQTLELVEKVLGKEHPDTLSSINNLANVLYHQGRYKEAEAIYRQTLELMEKVLGKEHPSTLTSMNNLANVLRNQGKYKEAEQMHRQTLELREKVLGKEHPSTLTSMNNLANVLRNQGKYKEAEQMHRQTLELREKVLGKEHPDTLDSISNLAGALYGQGRYEEAEAIHRQTLELMEKVLGKEHPDTLGSINNLATVLQDQGKYEEAEQMHRQTLELREKMLGKEHPGTLRSMNNLANVLRNQARYKEAEQMHRQTLELREKVLGKEHPDTLSSINNLASVLSDQGRYEEAEPIYRQTLELMEKVLGKEHPHTAISRDNLAECLGQKEMGQGL